MDGHGALGGAQAHRRGHLRSCPGPWRDFRIQGAAFLRTRVFCPQGRGGANRGRDLARLFYAYAHQARGGAGSRRHRAADHLSGPLDLPDRDRVAGPRRPRRPDGAVGTAQAEARHRGPVRRGAQTAAAVPAGSHRCGDVSNWRRDPRHPASPRRALPAPRAGVAGAGAGRRRVRGDRRGDYRLQCAAGGRRHSTAGPADRGARWRLDRGSVVLQRGDRGAGGRRRHDPADLRGRPRDRRDADRFRRRPPSADPDGGGRDGGPGARRLDRAVNPGPPYVGQLGPRPRSPAHRIACRNPGAAIGR